MSDIQHLIKMLQSDNHNKRYDACEELRVLPSLPPEALEALRLATNDPNPSVADAAQRAIAIHTPQLTPEEEVEVVEQERDETNNKTVKNWPLIGLLMGIFPGLVLLFLVRDAPAGFLYTLCIGPVGIIFGMIGAYIGKKDKESAWIAAFGFAILGAGIAFALAIFSCIFCM